MSFSSSSKGMKDAGAPAFLEKLFDMLEDRDNFEYIAWQPTGDAFLIKKVNELQEIVLPKFFKHNNLQSFVRQLNMYSFSKTCHDPNYREVCRVMSFLYLFLNSSHSLPRIVPQSALYPR